MSDEPRRVTDEQLKRFRRISIKRRALDEFANAVNESILARYEFLAVKESDLWDEVLAEHGLIDNKQWTLNRLTKEIHEKGSL